MLLSAAFPDLSSELRQLLQRRSELTHLASKVADLDVVELCGCAETDCTSMYTAAKPDGAYGPGHTNHILDAEKGMIVLDVVNDRIVYVEVLGRPDYRARFDELRRDGV